MTDDIVPQPVFDLRLHDPAGRIAVFRSEKIPGLYPRQYVKPPNGVGDSLVLDRNEDSIQLAWGSSPVDPAHSAADYYTVYVSDAPGSGFSILDTSVASTLTATDAGETLFFKVAAANLAGTSGDEP